MSGRFALRDGAKLPRDSLNGQVAVRLGLSATIGPSQWTQRWWYRVTTRRDERQVDLQYRAKSFPMKGKER